MASCTLSTTSMHSSRSPYSVWIEASRNPSLSRTKAGTGPVGPHLPAETNSTMPLQPSLPAGQGLAGDMAGRDSSVDGGDLNCSVHLDTCLGVPERCLPEHKPRYSLAAAGGAPAVRAPPRGPGWSPNSWLPWLLSNPGRRPLTGQRQEVGGRALPSGTWGHSSRRRKRGRAHTPF